jgi:thiol-disulfide isomerase/thioredoxin
MAGFGESSLKKFLSVLLLLTGIASLTPNAYAAKAIDFTLTDIQGKTFHLSDMKGKWVLINFWAPWCPRCWMEFPTLNDLDARKDFVVIGMAMDYGGDLNSVHNYINRYALRYPQVLGGDRRDPKSPAQQIGPIDFYPTSYLYDPSGQLVMFIPGLVSRDKMLAFLEQYNRENHTSMASDENAEPEPVKPANFSSPTKRLRSSHKKKISM